jgi:hypothetical protein
MSRDVVAFLQHVDYNYGVKVFMLATVSTGEENNIAIEEWVDCFCF